MRYYINLAQGFSAGRYYYTWDIYFYEFKELYFIAEGI